MSKLKIKKNKDGDFVAVWGENGLMLSILSERSDFEKAIASSEAHKWFFENTGLKKTFLKDSFDLPSSGTQKFVEPQFYGTVRLVVEQLVEREKISIEDAIKMGDSLIKGDRIIADNDFVMSMIKNALYFGKQISKF